MSLVEESEVTPGGESTALSKDKIQESIIEKKVTQAKPAIRNDKSKWWQKIFVFDKYGMTDAQVVAEQNKRRKQARKDRGSLRPKGSKAVFTKG